MANDETNKDDIRDLLRELRDGQRELIAIAKQDRQEWVRQRETWEQWQAEQNSPNWQLLNQANQEYVKESRLRRAICIALVCVGAVLVACMLIAGIFGWIEWIA